MAANAGIKADTLDNMLGVQSLHLGVGIQLIEVGHTQSQISISKQLDSLSFRKAHNQGIDILLDCTFLQQSGEGIGCLHQTGIIHIRAHNNTARIQVVVQSLALTQKLRAEDDIVTVVLFTNRSCKAHRNRRLDDHDSIRIILNNQLDNCFNRRGIKEVLLAIVVGRCCDDNKVCVLIGSFSIKCCCQVQVLLCQILFNVLVLNRRLLVINKVNLFRNNIHRHDLMMLRQQRGNRQTDVTGTCNCDFHSLSPFLYILPSLARLMT